ncbi:methyltransferase [Alteromonas lipolytica]|uniref:Ribosomal RNA large subunit methyltransferase G n=1 Tax=Alteromonas lipolytica TaxID=1856405 RepID=A0A1E8FD58_9ALTE|nr:methyltransferase [Alteromonas lipolytica]OFI33696.1 23S rRNA (guanine(1835)-N(2))-methyltransferase [Alteromonas lipolytica]GGF69276.1 ribosomal RNA large subunit methyltransferase G [Alteromonas lipolytica]
MTTKFTSFDRELTLIRYPAQHQHKSLQAWDSADELLIEQVITELSDLPSDHQRWLIFNDDFGTLGCMFADRQPLWISDSKIAWLSFAENLAANALPDVAMQDCLAPLPPSPALVLIKIPRTLALLESQLLALRKVVSPDTVIVAGAKVKTVTRSVLAMFERLIGPTRTSLARKKSRLIFCQPDQQTLNSQVKDPFPTTWPCHLPNGHTVKVANHANVFSRQSLDIGARFLLEHMQVSDHDNLVDLGCGNGVLGLNALNLAPSCKVTFVDESYMAIASARQNVADNFPGQLEQCQFVASNCLESLLCQPARPVFTKVFCNPPFHQQNTITDHIAWQMFHDAFELLGKGGHLIVVANRHLDYYHTLKRLFGGVTTLASQNKFVIFSAAKR